MMESCVLNLAKKKITVLTFSLLWLFTASTFLGFFLHMFFRENVKFKPFKFKAGLFFQGVLGRQINRENPLEPLVGV